MLYGIRPVRSLKYITTSIRTILKLVNLGVVLFIVEEDGTSAYLLRNCEDTAIEVITNIRNNGVKLLTT
jgi:hypothetical protein